MPSDYDDAELIEAMVGRAVAAARRASARRCDDGVPAVAHAARASGLEGDRGHEALKDVDLDVRPGELVGVAGVAGSGQRELCEVALGLRDVTAGAVIVNGVTLKARDPARARWTPVRSASPRTR